MFNPNYVMFIGLNPSTADEKEDDNTIRRCIDYAKQWGYGALCMANLFAFKATKPKDMKAATHPVGLENDKWLVRCSKEADIIIAAWGADGGYLGRDEEVLKIIKGVMCLGITKEGKPRHPLFLKKTAKPETYYFPTPS